MIKAPTPREGEITPYCDLKEKATIMYGDIKMNGKAFVMAMQNDLLRAKTKDDFKDTVFRYAYMMPKQCFLMIDDLFTTTQPKYRAYFIECFKMYIDLTRWDSKNTIYEFNNNYTKIRKL